MTKGGGGCQNTEKMCGIIYGQPLCALYKFVIKILKVQYIIVACQKILNSNLAPVKLKVEHH